MVKTFLERLQAGDVLVADGATGTNLQAEGLKPGVHPEAWVFDQSEKILGLHKAFVAAGADIILTCTFGGTSIRLKDTSLASRVKELNQRAAELARQAAGGRDGVLVAGSMGPTGSLLKPFGPLSPEEVVEAYAEQALGLTAGGVDLLLVETQFSIDEARSAVEGAHRSSTLPIVVSFSYDRGLHTMMGVKPSQVVQTFKPIGVAAIGANCGTTLENMELLVQEYRTIDPGLIIWAKPNAGLPVMNAANETIYNITPDQMASFAQRYVQAGARIVGGCCGSTPAHVAAMVKAVKKG